MSCAYSGRVAAAYRMGGVKSSSGNTDDKFVNLCVSIYECESTGACPCASASPTGACPCASASRQVRVHLRVRVDWCVSMCLCVFIIYECGYVHMYY